MKLTLAARFLLQVLCMFYNIYVCTWYSSQDLTLTTHTSTAHNMEFSTQQKSAAKVVSHSQLAPLKGNTIHVQFLCTNIIMYLSGSCLHDCVYSVCYTAQLLALIWQLTSRCINVWGFRNGSGINPVETRMGCYHYHTSLYFPEKVVLSIKMTTIHWTICA